MSKEQGVYHLAIDRDLIQRGRRRLADMSGALAEVLERPDVDPAQRDQAQADALLLDEIVTFLEDVLWVSTPASVIEEQAARHQWEAAAE